jgi:hypothetical protein
MTDDEAYDLIVAVAAGDMDGVPQLAQLLEAASEST